MKIRADVLLTMKGLAASREKAQALIMAGKVFSGDRRIQKASEQFDEETPLTVRDDDMFASRGGYKLEKALGYFDVDPAGVTAIDIGAASGGFTDVLLRAGAAHVYAVDVGYGQLDWRLRNDDRVTVMERTNARYLKPEDFPVRPALAVMDVSFISVKLILPAVTGIIGREGQIVSLIKPQFEAGKGLVGKHGVVREESTHTNVLSEVEAFVDSISWRVSGFTYSPIKGPAGNIEFLAHIVAGEGPRLDRDSMRSLVREAHEALK